MKKCSKCNEVKSDSFFYYQKGKPSGYCKPCRGIKIKINNGLKYCKKCDESKPYEMFYSRLGKPGGYCKPCLGIKYSRDTRPNKEKKQMIIESNKNDEILIREYIRRVILRKYEISVVDMYKIIHYHQILWNNDQESNDIPFVMELKTKWNNLERWYDTTKID